MKSTSDSQILSLFPLPNVVLFPNTQLPLYIFEPRYRAMTHAALKGDRRIGMVAIRPEALSEASDPPAVFAIGCEGEISEARERPDGTLDILVAAKGRFKIIEESPISETRPYRVAYIQSLDEEMLPDPPSEIGGIRQGIFQTLNEIVVRSGSGDEPAALVKQRAALKHLETYPDEAFVHVVAQSIHLGVHEKQRLIEASGAGGRYRMLEEFLAFHLAELKAKTGPGSNTIH